MEIIVGLLERGRYTRGEAVEIQDALITSIANNLGERTAWIKTPWADANSRVTHSWLEESERSLFRSSCRLVLPASAYALVGEDCGAREGLRRCRRCELAHGRWGKPIKLGELYGRTSREILGAPGG